jgi:hypothetical protein
MMNGCLNQIICKLTAQTLLVVRALPLSHHLRPATPENQLIKDRETKSANVNVEGQL